MEPKSPLSFFAVKSTGTSDNQDDFRNSIGESINFASILDCVFGLKISEEDAEKDLLHPMCGHMTTYKLAENSVSYNFTFQRGGKYPKPTEDFFLDCTRYTNGKREHVLRFDFFKMGNTLLKVTNFRRYPHDPIFSNTNNFSHFLENFKYLESQDGNYEC